MHKIRKGWSAYNIGFKFHVIINKLKVFLGSKNGNIFFVCRRSYFETFWFTHHLFVVFFAGLVVHGTG